MLAVLIAISAVNAAVVAKPAVAVELDKRECKACGATRVRHNLRRCYCKNLTFSF